jgi:hypothetical protein
VVVPAVEIVRGVLARSPDRMAMLCAVAELGLPDAWLAAGAIRNVVWDALHDYDHQTPLADADVIWFDPAHRDPEPDKTLEAALSARLGGIAWSVKNQARMHHRHGHAPYAGSLDSMRFWTETATTIAARLAPDGQIEMRAAYGFADLLALILRPGPRCSPAVFRQRVATKGWLRLWPRLILADEN